MRKSNSEYWMKWYHSMDVNDKKAYNHKRYMKEKKRSLQRELDALENKVAEVGNQLSNKMV